MTVTDLEARFRQAMADAGLRTDAEIVADGELHRVEWNDDDDRAGWYVLHCDDPAAGVFGCWRRGVQHTWCAESPDDFSDEARKRWHERIRAQREQRARERRERRERARRKARGMLEEADPAHPGHPYLRAKGVPPHGAVRQLGDTLLVPLYGSDGALRGLQRIRPDASKRFIAGTEVSGSYLPIGDAPAGTVVVAEGYSTGATIHKATSHPVAVAFSANNLRPVAEALREELGSDVRLIIAADNDRETEGNPGVTAAAEAAQAVRGALAVPRFEDGEEGSDFNDLAAVRGPRSVREAIQAAETPEEPSGDVFALLRRLRPAAVRGAS